MWPEEQFPVAELAYQPALWLWAPDAGRADFALGSMQAAEGLIRITRSAQGWREGSVRPPAFWSAPVSWADLVSEIRRFDRCVREGVAALGVDPAFIPAP